VTGGIDDACIGAVAQVDINLAIVAAAVRAAGIHFAKYDVSSAVSIDVTRGDWKPYLTAATGGAVKYKEAVLVWVPGVDCQPNCRGIRRRRNLK